MWEKIFKDYFTFSKKERIAVVTLVMLIITFLLLPRMIPDRPVEIDHITLGELKPDHRTEDVNSDRSTLDAPAYRSYAETYTLDSYHASPVVAAGELFYFDPNTLSAAGWKRLGLPEKTIRTLKNYLARGGGFRKAGDIEKIYGLRREQVNRLLPFVRIAAPAETRQPEKPTRQPIRVRYAAMYAAPVRPLASIDINTADTSAFISLPGIGSKLAMRIVRFREKLGGFYATGQVSEIYGLPDSVFTLIKPRLAISGTGIRKINLNTIEAAQLREHPYFGWAVANAIIAYRRQHGNFINVESLMQIALINHELFKKIAPYVSLE